ncbi:hypothetical protein ACIA5D_09055 [Actinoplanes sp. NPDC051513]|uniref:hypothetical protein n=1 Tax=Actinoplanes sp. NPDC051513 TaxID=3363908 RepID=UPI0037B7ED27
MSMRRVAPAIALFFLSPVVAEFLLGDFTLAQLPFLVALAPAYGGAAVLVREVTRRAGRGWVTMILLALAYGVLEEGLETQSLFNPDYLDAHLLDHGFVPALGISIPWTLFVLTLHTVWSISVPIALVEEWTDRRTQPWLRVPGLVVVAVLAVGGAVFTFGISYADGHFMASPAQLVTTVVVVAGLITAAFLLPRDRSAVAPTSAPTPVPAPGLAPSPWIVLVTALGAGAVLAMGNELPAALAVPLLVVVLAGTAVAIYRWSARSGWDGRHRLAAAGGALLTYAWHSFLMHPVVEASTALVVVSHVVFALAALLLLAAEVRRLRDRAPVAGQPVG